MQGVKGSGNLGIFCCSFRYNYYISYTIVCTKLAVSIIVTCICYINVNYNTAIKWLILRSKV